MRLKSLRKERPAFEAEGAVINGNRIDLLKGDSKLAKHRSNTSFALPTSFDAKSCSTVVSLSDRSHEMNARSRQQIVIPIVTQPANLPSYQAIEAAYLEQGIRIRVSPTRSGQQSGTKSAASLQRHTAFASRNPSRTSSVLHYAPSNLDQQHDSRSFSALQQTSSNDFEQVNAHNVSYAQSSQINEETYYSDYFSASIIASEHSNPCTPPEKVPPANETVSTTALFDNDPDLLYMSALLKKSSGDAFRDIIRRRAGLRGTFSAYRNPLTASSIQPQMREKSPPTNRNSLTRMATIAVLPPPSARKIDKDIIKHASRIRRMSQSKDHLAKSSEPDPSTSPRRMNHYKQNSANKPSKSMSLKPLEFLLSPATRPASLSTHDLPSMKTPSNSRKLKTPIKRSKSAKILTNENENSTNSLSKQNSTSSSILHDESLSLMRTSPLDMAHQSSSFDSGYYDHSSSGGDVQSLTSSSIIQNPSSVPSARLTSSAVRRSNSNKRVSFYEEPTTVVITTATYV